MEYQENCSNSLGSNGETGTIWYGIDLPGLLWNRISQCFRTPWIMNAENWRKILKFKLDNLDTNLLIEDVQAFLEHPDDARLLTRENLQLVLE